MVRLESAPLAAIRAGPVPPLQELDPFDSRVRARGANLASAPPGVDALPDVAVLAAVLSEIRRELFFVPFLIRAIRGRVLGRMAFAPATHRFTSLRRICPYPFAGILATAVNVLVRHQRSLAGPHHRCKRSKKDTALIAASLLRGNDSNVRPSGYEPDELPLLHPANQFYL